MSQDLGLVISNVPGKGKRQKVNSKTQMVNGFRKVMPLIREQILDSKYSYLYRSSFNIAE